MMRFWRLLFLAAILWAVQIPAVLKAATPVRTAQAREGQRQEEITLSGRVVASRRALIASEVSGLVDKLSVRIGDRVRAGAPLARLRSVPLELQIDAAVAELSEAQARLRSSLLRLERLQELSGSQVVSRQRVDDALFEKQADAARVERLEAEQARLVDRLQRSTVRAPFSGAIVEEHTQKGEWLDAGDAVVELVSLDQVEIRLDIPETHRQAVTSGSKALLRFVVLGGREIAGEVRAVVPHARDNARTFPAFIRLLEEIELGIGSTVEATLSLGEASGAVWVPRDAVVRRAGQTIVFRLTEGSGVESVEVEKATDQGDWLAILGDVAVGDALVIEGNETLEDGEVVTAEPREYAWP